MRPLSRRDGPPALSELANEKRGISPEMAVRLSKPPGSGLYSEIMRLACAMIYVRDLPRMKDFYQSLFGAQPVNTEWMETWALFDAGGARLALHAVPTEMARNFESPEISSPPKAREASPVKLIFAVDDVPAERKRLEAMGIAILQRPWQNAAEECEGIDPEGNIFQISSVRL